MTSRKAWVKFGGEFRMGFAFGRVFAHQGMSSAKHRGPTKTSVYDKAFMHGYKQQQRIEEKK